MAGETEQTDVRIYCNWKNLTMLNYFLRPKVLGLTLVGRTDLIVVDPYMHHPSEIFGSEPEWQHKFFFTHPIRYPPRAHRPSPKARVGYWLRNGRWSEIIKENDGTGVGVKLQSVFNEGRSFSDSQRTNWRLNQYEMFEEQMHKCSGFKDDNNKTWILCELFHEMGVDQNDLGQIPNVELLVGDDQPSMAISIHVVEVEQFEQNPGSPPGPSLSEEVDQPPRASDGGEGDTQTSASSVDWANMSIEDFTTQDCRDFEAFFDELMDIISDSKSWAL